MTNCAMTSNCPTGSHNDRSANEERACQECIVLSKENRIWKVKIACKDEHIKSLERLISARLSQNINVHVACNMSTGAVDVQLT